jgi:hypothetical protein
MGNFTVEQDEAGKYVLVNNDTGQRTTYATEAEAENAKKHLTEQAVESLETVRESSR